MFSVDFKFENLNIPCERPDIIVGQ